MVVNVIGKQIFSPPTHVAVLGSQAPSSLSSALPLGGATCGDTLQDGDLTNGAFTLARKRKESGQEVRYGF